MYLSLDFVLLLLLFLFVFVSVFYLYLYPFLFVVVSVFFFVFVSVCFVSICVLLLLSFYVSDGDGQSSISSIFTTIRRKREGWHKSDGDLYLSPQFSNLFNYLFQDFFNFQCIGVAYLVFFMNIASHLTKAQMKFHFVLYEM